MYFRKRGVSENSKNRKFYTNQSSKSKRCVCTSIDTENTVSPLLLSSAKCIWIGQLLAGVLFFFGSLLCGVMYCKSQSSNLAVQNGGYWKHILSTRFKTLWDSHVQNVQDCPVTHVGILLFFFRSPKNSVLVRCSRWRG
jgi:hypothetical protein